MAEFAKMCREDYGLKRQPITTRNPQANDIMERVHQTLGRIIQSFDVKAINEADRQSMGWNTSSYHACSKSHIPYHTTGITNAVSVRIRCHAKYQAHNELGTYLPMKTNMNQ